MPELAEVRIMSEYVNRSCQGKTFTQSNLDLEMGVPFNLSSISRGKEMKIIFVESDIPQGGYPEIETFTFGMGMTGSWQYTPVAVERPKHTRLWFEDTEGGSLSLVDTRRFAKWRKGGFSTKRSPDPTIEPAAFKRYLQGALLNKRLRVFDTKNIGEIMMDQKYFNGIGNYLRAEILHRMGVDPRTNAREMLEDPVLFRQLCGYCKTIPEEVLAIGGGQAFTWKNPQKSVDPQAFWNWIRIYNKGKSYVDKTGRRMWYYE